MQDASKSNEKKPEESSKDIKEKIDEESKIEPEVQPEKETEELTEKQDETAGKSEGEEKVEEISEEVIDKKHEDETIGVESKAEIEKPSKGKKPVKADVKKDKPRKDRGPDFKYIVRLSNTDVDGEKNVVYGLTTIKGIGVHMATHIADITDIDRNMKIGDLKDPQIEKLQASIDSVNKNAPSWMLNHRKDYETGDDIHLIGSEIDMKLRDEINIMKKIRSYRGIRHERGLPVRGQRTRANSRTGLTLGVSKKRALSKSSAKNE